MHRPNKFRAKEEQNRFSDKGFRTYERYSSASCINEVTQPGRGTGILFMQRSVGYWKRAIPCVDLGFVEDKEHT